MFGVTTENSRWPTLTMGLTYLLNSLLKKNVKKIKQEHHLKNVENIKHNKKAFMQNTILHCCKLTEQLEKVPCPEVFTSSPPPDRQLQQEHDQIKFSNLCQTIEVVLLWFYNCNEKYFPWKKSRLKKIFGPWFLQWWDEFLKKSPCFCGKVPAVEKSLIIWIRKNMSSTLVHFWLICITHPLKVLL